MSLFDSAESADQVSERRTTPGSEPEDDERRPFLTTAVKDEPASSAPYWAVATPVQ
jgi:hypothetical protein